MDYHRLACGLGGAHGVAADGDDVACVMRGGAICGEIIEVRAGPVATTKQAAEATPSDSRSDSPAGKHAG